MGACQVWIGTRHGKSFLLVRTGLGKQRAREGLKAALNNFHVTSVISTGFAGGAKAGLRIGDLVVADSVLELQPGKEWKLLQSAQPTRQFTSDPDWVERVMQSPPPDGAVVHRGDLLSVDEVVSLPQNKAALGRFYDVTAVEMETAALAQIANERSLPFISVRSISDTVEEELINASPLLKPNGEVAVLKAGWFVLTHPGAWKDLRHLQRNADLVAGNLAKFIQAAIIDA
ncbi:MAG: hypothetical protein COV67_09990 [Nitrospinae bacterium CG11_big_fil_rev_8_21_14_0_20_56_8]|nr:MAG: hypothetical protein COV67_09990 [Nitrospinae bacterium CG11_big_fil_rev_8_21_14_0_20_56_8]